MHRIYALPVEALLSVKEYVNDLSAITAFLLGKEQVLIVVADHSQLNQCLIIKLDLVLVLHVQLC